MTTELHDSRADTLVHIQRVNALLLQCCALLMQRARVHDASKLEEPEKAGFDRLMALKLSNMKYGTEEYRACLRAEQPAIDHHYAYNSHHPEHYPKREASLAALTLRAILAHLVEILALPKDHPGIEFSQQIVLQEESSVNGMDLFDVIEMLMDWKAATERMQGGGDIRASLTHNAARFGMSPQLVAIFANTIERIGW